jgi:hypothetical protein
MMMHIVVITSLALDMAGDIMSQKTGLLKFVS